MQKWKVCLTFESEGTILMESKLYILEENEMKNRLEEIRKERGIRQEELARALEVSRQTIGSLENGRYNPSILLAFKICCGIRICEGQLLCEYSAFMGNSMGSNRFFASERIFFVIKTI